MQNYDKIYFDKLKSKNVKATYIQEDLTDKTISKIKDNNYEAISTFVNSQMNAQNIKILATHGIKYVFQRSAGFNNIDLAAAKKVGIKVFRVPSYSPESIAEFAMANLYALSRDIVISDEKIKNHNFAIDGLVGQLVGGKTLGVIGTGLIGQLFIKLAIANNLKVIVFDDFQKKHNFQLADQLGFKFVTLNKLCKESDYISLHIPLLPSTKYIINKNTLSLMKSSVRIINTARGALINTIDLLDALENNVIHSAALDVYENEGEYYYFD
jgi:D-lactate dehydrogenase